MLYYGNYEPDDIPDFPCPVCGESPIETVYLDENGKVLGCNCCVVARDVGEYLAEQDDIAREREIDRQTDLLIEQRWADKDID